MVAPSIVVLTTYPIVQPRHGGQIRTRALVDSYRAAGFKVAHLAVYEDDVYEPDAIGPLDVAFPTRDSKWFLNGRDVPACTDLRSGRFAAESAEAYRRIVHKLPKRIDVFHIEQPWLLPLVKRLKAEREWHDARVVYGSQNVEAPLRDAIFRRLDLPGGEEVVSAIRELESEACRYAELTLAVAPADRDTLTSLGARRLLLAPNGINAWRAPAKAIAKWKDKLQARRTALFVGSGHPPNYDGFFRAFGDALGFIPPDCRIIVAGAVGPPIAERYRKLRYGALNFSRLEITGEIDNDDLSALKTIADAFLLPIFDGGGSNIKTAEAIYSGKRVIATTNSLRGYDSFLKLPEISVANTRDEFQEAVRSLFLPTSPPPPGQIDGVELRSKLLWGSCLQVVPPAVKELLA